MRLLTSIFIVAFVLISSSCTPYYQAANFSENTSDHEIIAILPFEMVYTGMKPERLSREDILEIEEAESKAFQISFYNAILRSTRRGTKQIKIKIQDYQKTLRMLKDNNIDIRSSWDKSPEELARVLGVDAVVSARIQKHRYMSDLESYGISVGVHILDVISGHGIWPWLPMNISRSKEVIANYRLLDKKDGSVLWSVSFGIDANWSQKSNEIIDAINRRAGRKFPYRI